MKSSIHTQTPNGIQPSTNSSQSEAAFSAMRNWGGRFVWVASVAAMLFFLIAAPSARAHQSPVGCTGSGLGINLFTSSPDVHIGDTLTYDVTIFNGITNSGGRVVCDASGITASLTTPDNVVHPLTLVRTALSQGEFDFYTNVVSYVVRAQDVQPDGTVRSVASDTGVIHQNDTDSQGGGNQGVNTEVSLPCISLGVQCVGGVGENGLITFTGTVTNCGNNTLVGVTVTNFDNGVQFHVNFVTNLLQGQIASFSGNWLPLNPCVPSTVTLVAQGIDQFTTHPRTVTSSNSTTCAESLTPGIKVTKACPAQPVAPGQLLTFTGSVSNTGNVTLTNVVVVNNQPAANTVVYSVASLAPGAVNNFSGSYTAPTNCSVSDTLTATASSRCGVPVSDFASATCPIVASPRIAVTATCPAIAGAPGASATFGGTVSNTGSIPMTNIVVTSDRPSPGTAVFSAASLAPGASVNFTGTYTVPSSGCSYTTTFSVSGKDTCAGISTNATFVSTCGIATTPAIAVSLACPATPSATGGSITYSGTVQNSGNITLTNIFVVNSQPVPNTAVIGPITLAPGASQGFTTTFTAPANTCSVSSTVAVSGRDTCAATLVANTASATCSLATAPRIVVTQNCPPNPSTPGGTLTFSGSVSNAGNITVTNIVVTNDRSGATPVLISAALLPGATTNFTGSYTVPATSSCSVTSVVTAVARDMCTGNTVTDIHSTVCPVSGTPLIAVTLNCPVTPAAAGATITYLGTVSNPGNIGLNNVVVVDNQAAPSTVLTLPTLAAGASANFTASFSSPANTCTISSTVTATASNTCSGTMVSSSASATCPLATLPRIVVTQACPTNPASSGGVLTFSGSVSNAGNITLSNITVLNNQSALFTNSGPFSFGTINPPLVPPTGSVIPRFVVGSNFNGLVFAAQDEGYAANQFYSLRHEVSGNSTFVTINANGTVTGRFDAGNKHFDALAFAAPDVGYGPVIFYYLRHDDAGVSTFGTIKPGGATGVVADLFVVGNNFDALTFSATDVGWGANLFYYLRHDAAGQSFFGTINPALPGTVTDRFAVGANFDALAFTATDVGYGALNVFYFLRHDSTGRSTFGSIAPGTGTVTDRFTVGTNFTELAFTTTDAGVGANLFYYLGGSGGIAGTNTSVQPVFSAASLAPGASATFTGSYTVPSSNVCSVTSIIIATATDACSGNTVTNATTTTCPLITAPAIAVTLNCPEGATAPGASITYSGTVRNSGNITLNNVTVVDSQATPTTVFTVPSLAPGVSTPFNATFTTPLNACSVSSTVVARGTDACTSAAVTNSASATCPLGTAPSITITENCSATPVGPGGVLTFTGTIKNTGNITLTNVVVTSDRTGVTPVLTVATLAAGASANYTGSYTVPANGSCSITTVVSVTGKDTCSGIAASNTASVTCPITGTPNIFVTQNCPAIAPSPGGVLSYSGTVSNSGNVTLTNVVVFNNRSGINPILIATFLAPGASTNFTGSYNVPLNCCSVSSTATARGTAPCTGVTVTDTDTTTCPVLTAPAIVVTKVCPSGDAGNVSHYSGTVSNAGNITLINVTVVNNQPKTNSPVLGPITLAPGESVPYTASFTNGPDFCGTDTVTARGSDNCTLVVVTSSVTTTCPVAAKNPGIAVTKNCPVLPVARGGTYTFTGVVTNTGDVTLINVYVVDDQPSNNAPVIGPITLAPGASARFTNSYIAPKCCCSVLDTLTARGEDRCAGTEVAATASAECPLLSTPQLAVVEQCPSATVPAGGLFVFTGSVTNTGDVVLTNIYVVSSQPIANTIVLGPIELAPGESEDFAGSYTVVAGASGLIITATGFDTCQGRTATAAANCSGPITPPNQPRAISVVVNGNGAVSGVANGQLLNIGQSYTATATPGSGDTFINWSGGVSGASPSLTFVMKSNLVVIANFTATNGTVTDVFTPVAGVFNGLFFNADNVQTSNSGSFSLTMKASGSYTATLKNLGKGYSVKGTFNSSGQASNSITRSGMTSLSVNWQGDLSDSDYLSGTVNDGATVAQLTGGRNVFNKTTNAAPQAGKYTLIMPGIVDATNSPDGNGYGTVTVDTGGVAHFSGRLADDTTVTLNVALSKHGEWPLYVSLYSNKGMLIGWLQFIDDGTNDISGTLGWVKPNLPASKLYKLGFLVNSEAIGSHYLAPIGTDNMLDITSGLVVLSGGNLPDSSNPVTFGPSSKLVNNGPNTLKLTFTKSSGVFSGTFKETGTATTFNIKGAVLQRQNSGSGYAPGTNQSGRAIFEAAP